MARREVSAVRNTITVVETAVRRFVENANA
jgi:hypothetical protein